MKDLAAWAAIITIAGTALAAVMGFGREQDQLATTSASVSTLSKRADDTDSRLRSLETSQAATAAALSAIQRDADAQSQTLERVEDKLDAALSHRR